MNRALFVVSTWKPCMMADMQRARQIAAHMPAHGWEVEILAPDGSFQTDFSAVQGEGIAFPDVPLHQAKPWNSALFDRIGSRNIGIRASVPVRRLGAQLCRERKYDLVYFTTTQHWLTCQGASWRRKFGTPYVADLHDPVYLEKKTYFISRHRLKERLAKHLGKTIERLALARADGIVSVSRGYIDDVARRNPSAQWLRRGTTLVEPFPADIDALATAIPRAGGEAGRKRVVYVGAGGNIMEKGWLELVACLQQCDHRSLPSIELHGTDTDWRKNKRRYLQDAAEKAGLTGVAEEHPARISYADSLSLVKGADGLLVLGVDDPNYRPSKLQTYLASGLPVLVLVHSSSRLATELASAGPGVRVVTFDAGGAARRRNVEAVRGFLADVQGGIRWSAAERKVLGPDASAGHHARFFEQVLESLTR